MNVFVAGATGALGRALLPMLAGRGHHVAALCRSERSMAIAEAGGARPFKGDALDQDDLLLALGAFRPEVVVNQLTSLPASADLRNFRKVFAETNRLRTVGGRNLIVGARAAGARRIVVQSFCGWPYARTGGPAKRENEPLDAEPPEQVRETLDAIKRLEDDVASAEDLEGVVLRYGMFYGPGTAIARGGSLTSDLRRRRVPLVGPGTGVFSFVHVNDAASATVAAVEGEATGIFNVVDDDPAPLREWLPHLARAAGAKPPARLPGWLAKLILPGHLYLMMTEARGGSNKLFKETFGWQPSHRSWRDGFALGLQAGPGCQSSRIAMPLSKEKTS